MSAHDGAVALLNAGGELLALTTARRHGDGYRMAAVDADIIAQAARARIFDAADLQVDLVADDAADAANLAAAMQEALDAGVLSMDDLELFAANLCTGWGPPGPGTLVSMDEVARLHSDVMGEDGRRVQLYDLEDGHSAISLDGGPLRRAD